MTDQQNQPTRTPPTEPGDWEFTRADGSAVYRLQVLRRSAGDYWCRNAENTISCGVLTMPPGYWRRAAPLEPFAPKLPVVELWEGEDHANQHREILRVDDAAYCNESRDRWSYVVKSFTNLRRTHVCKWEPCDE